MNTEILKLEDKMLEDSIKEVKKKFRDSHLYSLVRALNPYNPDYVEEVQMKTLKALEEGIAIYIAANKKLYDYLSITTHKSDITYSAEKLKNEIAFANLYAIFLSSYYISEKTKNILEEHKLEPTYEEAEDTFPLTFLNKDRDVVTAELTKMLTIILEKQEHGIKAVRNPDDFVMIVNQLFKEMQKEAVKEKDRFELSKLFENIEIEFYDKIIKGFEYKQEKKKLDIEEVLYEDIVGNKELIKVLKQATTYLRGYDPKLRKNFFRDIGDFATKIFVKGTPGTGKTTCIKAFLSDTKQKLAKQGIDFEPIIIGNDIKDKYFGESVKKLKAKLDKAQDGKKCYAIIIEDIDAVFASRNDPDISSAERSILQELMNSLEGVASKDLGNVVFITSSNMTASESRRDPIDEALLGRIAESTIVSDGPTTVEDYIKLIRDIKLKKEVKAGSVDLKDQEWLEIAELCKKYKLSGRDIKNICKQLSREIMKLDNPDEIFKYETFEERMQAAYRQMKKIKAQDVITVIEEYAKFMENTRNEQEKQLFEAKVKAIITDLRAQAVASAQFEGKESIEELIKILSEKI